MKYWSIDEDSEQEEEEEEEEEENNDDLNLPYTSFISYTLDTNYFVINYSNDSTKHFHQCNQISHGSKFSRQFLSVDQCIDANCKYDFQGHPTQHDFSKNCNYCKLESCGYLLPRVIFIIIIIYIHITIFIHA